jgi:branched-chain amino acid transport system substrate-binding protein
MHNGLGKRFAGGPGWLVLLLLAISVLCGCKRSGSGSAPGGSGATRVKIVSSLPRTGSANAQTTTIVNGIRMAIDEVGGKAGTFSVSYEDWDDASARKGDWDPEVEAANAHRAVKDPDVVAYIGTYNSGAAKISMPILNKAGLVMISPANTYTGLTKPGLGEAGEPDIYRPSGKINFFRVVPADDIQGKGAAEWMHAMGGKSVYVLDDRGLYGKGIADVFTATSTKLGLRVLGREGIDPKAQEYRSLMSKIKALDPDWVYFGGTTQSNAGQIAKDLVAVGLRAKLMLPDGCFERAFIESAGAEVANERAHLTFGGVPAGKLTGKGAEFVERYRKLHKKEPEAYAVYGYVAAKVALDAIAQAGKKDREAIRSAVAGTKQENGALGSWSFDANGDTTLAAMSGNIVRAGTFEFVTLLGQGAK